MGRLFFVLLLAAFFLCACSSPTESVDHIVEPSLLPSKSIRLNNPPSVSPFQHETPSQSQASEIVDTIEQDQPEMPIVTISSEYTAGIDPDVIVYAAIIRLYRDFIYYYEIANFPDCVDNTASKIADYLGIEYNIYDEREAWELHCSLYEVFYGNLGYDVRDINSDGIPELIILSDEYTVHAIYSLNNDKLILIGAYWSRYSCAIDETGTLFIDSSSGAADSYSASYRIAPANVELELIEMVGIEDYDELTDERLPEPRYYQIKKGIKEIIEYEEAFVFWDDFPNKYPRNPTKDAGLDFVPLFQSTEEIIQNVDTRISWIVEGLGDFIHKDGELYGGHYEGFSYKEEKGYRDYYNSGSLVYRAFSRDIDHENSVHYTLYYSENGQLAYSEMVHYRGAMYEMYFHNNELLHIKVGPFSSAEGAPFIDGDLAHAKAVIKEDDRFSFVLDDLSACLENAYS